MKPVARRNGSAHPSPTEGWGNLIVSLSTFSIGRVGSFQGAGHPGGYSIAAGDFNNDHAPDLAIPIEEYGKVAILLNTQ